MRNVTVLFATIAALAIGLVACGGSDAAKKAAPAPTHQGMTDEEMKCMVKKYASAHPNVCPGADQPAESFVTPLSYTADGLVDATKVDLSGVEGLSEEDQTAAEELLVSTVKTLPKWSNYDQAVADGFQSIQDGITGEEHLLHWDWIDDATIFDPNRPESLVYGVDRKTGTKTLEAAMFILPKEYTLDNTPAIDSKLVQFHMHDNLCFTPPPAPRVAGLTDGQGGCGPGLTKFNPNIQVHVWIRANPCGPFAALLGVGAGQIKPGAERACDMDHGRVGL